MAGATSKHVIFEQKQRLKCFPSCQHLIYDEPYVFRVRSERPSSYSFACETCLKAVKRQQALAASNQYQKRCSRLPPAPIDFKHINRPNTSPSKRTHSNCTWNKFMKNKSRYAINTPHALCHLTNNEQDSENRPPFVNYGGRYNDKQYGEKRTFNSLAVHQLKHDEVNEERAKIFLREQRLRRQAENYFREMDRRKFHEQDAHSDNEYQNNDRSSQD